MSLLELAAVPVLAILFGVIFPMWWDRRRRRKGFHSLLCGECGRTYVGPVATLCPECYPRGVRGHRES